MPIRFGRRGRLITLASGMAAAAAVAIAASGPALADTADTGGTAAISVPQSFVTGLAKSSVILFAGAPATSSYATGIDTYSLTVTGGNGEVSTFTGVVDLGGTLVAVNAANGKTATISNLQLNFYTGALTGQVTGSTAQIAVAYLGGDLSDSSDPGPPATETVTADQLNLSLKAARALNAALSRTAFKRGAGLGGFTTTFDVTVS